MIAKITAIAYLIFPTKLKTAPMAMVLLAAEELKKQGVLPHYHQSLITCGFDLDRQPVVKIEAISPTFTSQSVSKKQQFINEFQNEFQSFIENLINQMAKPDISFKLSIINH